TATRRQRWSRAEPTNSSDLRAWDELLREDELVVAVIKLEGHVFPVVIDGADEGVLPLGEVGVERQIHAGLIPNARVGFLAGACDPHFDERVVVRALSELHVPEERHPLVVRPMPAVREAALVVVEATYLVADGAELGARLIALHVYAGRIRREPRA